MSQPIRVDIVSDVVCPWCIIGFLQLQAACSATRIGCEVHWHPFELNPGMPEAGQNVAEHLAEKYGTTPEQSRANRDGLVQLGASLGYTFAFSGNTLIHNTFRAHQLIRMAGHQGKAHQMKLALFQAHFTNNRNINDPDILADIAGSTGLARDAVLKALEDGTYAAEVREEQSFWAEQGISGVPTMIFDAQYMLTGAQGAENYGRILQKVMAEREAA